ncbi:hypothetical protein [Thiorhodococcus minor]|uniref:Uncharacterized protein n=1 Tax=Thiorhodococcus minor TaxID=57489 RepID=A0A6M0K590_9GAMM|nr:hypothetical protein [Thiorhodococcus minor]NEV64948.1 hypothetical protein [Thiorhodococcus minor]
MTASTQHTTKRVLSALLSALLLGAGPVALAANFPERIASEERSAKVGLGVEKLALLKRLPGPGAEKVSAELLDRLHGRLPGVFTSDRFQREVTEERTSLVSDEGWYMNVYGDGTSVRYRNYPYLEKTSDLARPLEERMSKEELEERGRAFIAEHLAGLVPLGPGEELVPYFTEVEVTGGGAAREDAPMDPELVHASTIVFARSVNGLPVVGGGSKIAVIFANDGEAVGFDYDWPSYAASRRAQKVLPVDKIRGRGNAYSPFKSEDPEVKVLHFECGYVDLGARKRDPAAVVQGGCMRHASRKSIMDHEAHAKDERSGHVVTARLDYLPAGERVEPDAVWEKAPKRSDVEEPGPVEVKE